MTLSKTSAVIYRGPSMIDGAPIVVVATGLGKASTNSKTGDIVQTWIIREDINPNEAVNSGADASICGDCPHRGEVVNGKNVGRSCYVTVFQAPLSVWKSYRRGIYPGLTVAEAAEAMAGKTVRLGAYGDPAAVPMRVWNGALAKVVAVTGYTHQWRDFPALKAFAMASCDSVADYLEAKAAGWRTFRVRAAGEALQGRREVACPASAEMGAKTTCALCKACGGASSKARVDIAILAHGAPSKVNAFAARIAA